MSTLLWVIGFVLMMASFSFLFGRSEEPSRPRISVEQRWPDPESEG
ncbi:MAG: hypothetical protein KAY37_11130 [Phycisphaerae bacterium]|nr:hypothetical protein [Phycisphaerae bacterium]